MAVLLTPTTGPLDGGTEVVLAGPELDMTAGSDDFSAASLDLVLWTPALAGTGAVSQVSAANAVEFDTGSVAASSAGIETSATATSLDAQVTFRTQLVSLPAFSATAVLAQMSLVASTVPLHETDIHILIERYGSLLKRSVTARVDGTTTRSVSDYPGRFDPAESSVFVFRILRAQNRVLVFSSSRLLLDLLWSADPATVLMTVANDPSDVTRVVSRISSWIRRPVVTFSNAAAVSDYGPVPMTAPTYQSPMRYAGLTPFIPNDVRRDPLTTTVDVAGYAGASAAVSSGFVFTLRPDLIQFASTRETFTVLNDSTLRRRRSR